MKKRSKGIVSLLLAAFMVAVMAAGCGAVKNEETDDTQEVPESTVEDVEEATDEAETEEDSDEEAVVVRIGGMSGPTSMGLVKLMDDADNGRTENVYEFADLATEASAFVAPLSQGELDIAAVPSNLASVLYNNTDGGIQVLAINNLCVLNIVERGESIQSVEDLSGKTIYATGEGATPEYTLRYLLKEHGVDPDTDVEIQWCADTTEALSYVTNDEAAIAMLPQPFVTVALSQVEDLRVALDLNDVWTELDNGCEQITGVIVVRKEFAQQNPEAVETFLREYEASMAYTAEDAEGAAALIEQYGIVGKAAVAQKALPGCHLNFEAGSEMKTSLEGFLQILYDENPASVGGSLPGEDFYYGI
jgi:NitT/TauT family transport system substrate-binding protein